MSAKKQMRTGCPNSVFKRGVGNASPLARQRRSVDVLRGSKPTQPKASIDSPMRANHEASRHFPAVRQKRSPMPRAVRSSRQRPDLQSASPIAFSQVRSNRSGWNRNAGSEIVDGALRYEKAINDFAEPCQGSSPTRQRSLSPSKAISIRSMQASIQPKPLTQCGQANVLMRVDLQGKGLAGRTHRGNIAINSA